MIGLVCANASLGVGFELARDDVGIVSGRGTAICEQLRARGRFAACVEEAVGADERITLSGAAILDHPHVADALAESGCDALLPFKPSRKLEARAAQLGVALYAADAQVVRQLENKLSLPGIAADARVRAPDSQPVVLTDELLAGSSALPRVFQPAVGFAGSGTQLVEDESQLRDLVHARPGAAGKLAQYVAGAPVTVAGCVVDGSFVPVGHPVRQLTGIELCSAQPFGSCGNDWSVDQASAEALAVRTVARSVGRVLAARGFRGLFGIDVVLDAYGDVWLIEVNPRVTASLALALQLQASSGGPTLLDAHVLAFAPKRVGVTRDEIDARFPADAALDSPGPAASIVVYNRTPERLTPVPFAPGRYRLAGDGAFEHAGPELHVTDLDVEDVIVLPASSGLSVSAGAELCRIVLCTDAAVDASARTLTQRAESTVRAVRSALGG